MGKDIFQLEMIIDYCEEIENVINRFGDDEEHFLEDRHYRDLCAFYIGQIGENVKALSERSTEKYANIRWRGIRETRDDIAHRYHKVNEDQIWYSITKEIPVLKEACTEILKDIRSGRK
ncbi:MAG: DUF86 domain-containing protein [Methanomassiliicoccaceae archaeon]|nr:DUF86 domain-containing protein [Methanomassiliicoccaceae archaeon]